MNETEYRAVKTMLELRDQGYGKEQKNTLTFDRWIVIVDTGSYYHAEARLKGDIPMVLHRMAGGAYFEKAKLKAPGEVNFQSYIEAFGGIPEPRTEEDMNAEAAFKLRQAREEAGWTRDDYISGHKDPSIGSISLNPDLPRAYGTYILFAMVLGFALFIMWFIMRGN